MHAATRPTTPYPEISAVLAALLDGVRTVLGPNLAGLYLHGSLAAGGFDPDSSDIDVVAATTAPLSAAAFAALAAMHTRLRAGAGPWAARLEGSYIPLSALRRYDPADAVHARLSTDGRFAFEPHEGDGPILRHVLRANGIALAGPAPHTLIEPVTPDDLRHATRAILVEWWQPQLADPHRLYRRDYAAYAVLTMCRALYTLEHGAVAPKPDAARWALTILDPRWQPLIGWARTRRQHDTAVAVDEVIALIRLVIARW